MMSWKRRRLDPELKPRLLSGFIWLLKMWSGTPVLQTDQRPGPQLAALDAQ
jgi:hypothetical protein